MNLRLAPVNLAWAALVIAIALVLVVQAPAPTPRGMIGRPPPELELPDLSTGRSTHLRDAIGRGPVLVSFFASWCGPCADEAPVLVALRTGGVRIVGVAYRDAPAASARFLARTGNPYRTVLVDDAGEAGVTFALNGVPETFAVDSDGIIRGEKAGAISARDAEALLRAAGF